MSTSNPLSTFGGIDKYRTTPELTVSEDRDRGGGESQSIQKQEEAEEEELFKNVDPKKLAAVLLEALNHSQVEQGRKGEGHEGMEKEKKVEREKDKKEDANREVRTIEGADRDRDGRQELELLMAAQGKEQERGEEEEMKKAWEEEKMTEKVTSHTTSQTVQILTKKQPTSSDETGDNGQSAGPQQESTSLDQASSEEEEQLSPEELKSLEMMMKEFPRVNTISKREGDQSYREERDYNSYNDIIPINKGSDLAMTKKKLKWQEETQKALSLPKFRGDNFMDKFDDSNYGSNAVDPQALAEQIMEDDEPEEEEDEKMLSPEEEEARAKAEQEEMRRQAAEAQQAKMEEEKLADIASDMLLQYMVKQNNGNKHYSLSLPNAAEDKRSDEEQEITEEDDIDPQTIDKLIEISSKLHLPADDVVDIISDVEKKKKDLSPEMMSRWQRPTMSSPFSSTAQISDNQNNIPISKLPSPAVNFLKNWFQEKTSTRTEDIWSKPQLGNQNIWSKAQKPISIKQDLWFTSPKSVWTSYPPPPYNYPSYYQKKPYQDYPIYVPPAPRPKPHYFIAKPSLTFSNFLTNSVGDVYTFPPKRRYNSWVQARQRKPPPPGHQQRSRYNSYPLSLYPWTFQPVPIPKAHSLPRIYSQQKQLYYSDTAPAVTRNKDHYVAGKHKDINHDDLEKCIQQILRKRPHMID